MTFLVGKLRTRTHAKNPPKTSKNWDTIKFCIKVPFLMSLKTKKELVYAKHEFTQQTTYMIELTKSLG
jgi:hypothetical protein